MKKLILLTIDGYKRISNLTANRCRHYPSCSTYSKHSIEKHGVVVGIYLSLTRIAKCNPWVSPKIDLPPEIAKVK